MNEFLIEDETSFYEIDPECQVSVCKKNENGRKNRRRRNFPFFCEGEKEKSSREEVPGCPKWLLCWLFIAIICQDPGRNQDRRQRRMHCQ